MVGPVERMMTADSLRLTAYGPDEDEKRIIEDLPRAKTPHAMPGKHGAFVPRHAKDCVPVNRFTA
jgi:hypothetical protein